MTISHSALALVEQFECSGIVNNPKWLNAYQDTGGVWTIGIGTTRYPIGVKVKEGDTCTVEQAYNYCQHDMADAIMRTDALTVDTINQAQFDAIADFIYNKGWNAYRTSHLRLAINNDPMDYKTIVPLWLRWKFDNGVEEPGLLRRAQAEAYLYCHGELKFYFAKNETIF